MQTSKGNQCQRMRQHSPAHFDQGSDIGLDRLARIR
jgi:hypothetical protein